MMQRLISLFAVLAVAVSLTFVFWKPLWKGGGFVGGDVYPYFLPQKAYYAEHLRAGRFPLWNNRTGHGYPIVGESQTGAFYPFHVLLYTTFDLNTAYNANHLLHYTLAFVFAWMYARRVGLSFFAGLLAATVYVYGWYPARCSLEWAILGGTWLPLALWFAESFLQTRVWRHLIGLTVTLCVQMLAGHYSLAFITQLTLVAYVVVRLQLWRRESSRTAVRDHRLSAAALAVAFLLSFPLTAVQLAPTWELKQQSQRATVNAEHDPGFGHIPPIYWTQLVASWWFWYSPDVNVDRALQDMTFLKIPSRTNRVEAHLYFGLIPLSLIVVGAISKRRFDDDSRTTVQAWAWIAALSLVYTSGWLIPLTRHLPGFSFFEGPGRYGAATTFAAALLAAVAFDKLVGNRRVLSVLAGVVVIGLTTADLLVVARRVAVAVMVPSPPITLLDRSPVRAALAESDQPVRVFAPGPNLPTLLGVSATPQYLGIGPAAYYDPDLRIPASPPAIDAQYRPMSKAQFDWMHSAGVTHILSFDPIDPQRWPVETIVDAPDPFLNAAWGRAGFDRIRLYRLTESPGRLRLDDNSSTPDLRVTESTDDLVRIETIGDAKRVVLTDLPFPGWTVAVNGEPATSVTVDSMFRAVDVGAGHNVIEWKYRPASVYWGAIVSLLTVILLAAIAHVRFWHPRRLSWFDEETVS